MMRVAIHQFSKKKKEIFKLFEAINFVSMIILFFLVLMSIFLVPRAMQIICLEVLQQSVEYLVQ